MRLIDSHAHLLSEGFDDDREVLLGELAEQMEAIMECASAPQDFPRVAELVQVYPFLYGAVGVHPEEIAAWSNQAAEQIAQYLHCPKIQAVGEIGLDYYWAENPPRPFQQEIFRRQLALAQELDMPVIVHDREAHGDSLAIVKEFPGVRGVFHCYSGSAEMAQELIKLGWYLGFDGPITYKNARRAAEVAAVTPLERMVVETDSPYLSPVPLRGKRNDSRNLTYVLETLAAWKGVTPEEMARITLENGKRLYRLE